MVQWRYKYLMLKVEDVSEEEREEKKSEEERSFMLARTRIVARKLLEVSQPVNCSDRSDVQYQ